MRHLPFLKEGGTVVASACPILPVSALIGKSSYPLEEVLQYLKEKAANLMLIDSQAAAQALGSAKVLNMLLLGAAVRTGALGLEVEDIRAAMREKVPAKFHELNEKALMYTKEKGIS